MPQQETFLSEKINDKTVQVLKTYDRSFAREVFNGVGDEALRSLAVALEINTKYEPADIPAQEGPEYQDFLWEELCDAALEDVRQSPRLYSFFVVTETEAGKPEDLYISAEWPSAEEFARSRLARAL
jgi:hypothetical protein